MKKNTTERRQWDVTLRAFSPADLMKGDERKTSLRGNEFVDKKDERIRLRGLIDSLMAQAVLCSAYAIRYGYSNIEAGTGDIVRVMRLLTAADAREEKPEVKTILGMTFDELREASYNPKKELGLEHYFPGEDTDLMTAHLNMLRAKTREVELAFCCAEDTEVNRAMQLVLNRLSSAAYLLMLECRADRV